MLSASAFNAFLKTLEEPPSYAIFILATTERHKIIPTILSRCQIFDFSRISVENIVKHLQHVASSEGITAEVDGLHVIAQKADGALRDSLSIFDQLVSFAGNNLRYKDVIENLNILDYDYYFRITDDLLAGKIPEVLITFNEILNNGFDAHNFINGLASHFRDLLVCRDESTLPLLEVSPSIKEKYKVQSIACSGPWLLHQLDLASKADYQYRAAKNQRLHIELTLMKMCITDLTAPASGEGVKKKIDVAINKPVLSEAPPLVSAPPVSEVAAASPTPTPAPAPTQTQTQPQPQTQSQTQSQTQTPIRPATPVYKKTLSISEKLNGSAEKKSDEKAEEILPDIATPFDEESLVRNWNAYAGKLEKAGRMSLYAAMLKRRPAIGENFLLNFTVDSAAAEKDLIDEKLELLIYLRKALNNYKINLNVIVNMNEVSNDVAYTPSEKFKKLAEINPAMNDLRKSFDLEIEY